MKKLFRAALKFVTICISLGLTSCVGDTDHVTFGVEVEPDYKNHPRLGLYYHPESIDLYEWERLSEKKRTEIGFEKCNTKDYKTPGHDEWFYLIGSSSDGRQEIASLPERMHCDKPGSTEINGPVFETIDDFIKFITDFTENVGHAGSQGHVVFSKQYFDGFLGYILYESDRALFRRVKEEYQRYLDKGIVPGSIFRANALGPMTKQNWDYFVDNVERLKRGENLVFKGTGFGKCLCPHLRETYGPGLIGFELRTEDNPGTAPTIYKEGHQRLVEATKRLYFFLTEKKSFAMFTPLGSTEIPHGSGWNNFKSVFKDRLREIQDNASNDTIKNRAYELLEKFNKSDGPATTFNWLNWLAIYFKGNFLYPLRKWEKSPVYTESMQSNPVDLKTRLSASNEEIFQYTLDYIENIVVVFETDYGISTIEIAKDHNNSQIVDINQKYQTFASKWVYDMDFFKHFEVFENVHSIPKFDSLKIKYKF